jgi:hypothetical protein
VRGGQIAKVMIEAAINGNAMRNSNRIDIHIEVPAVI